MVYAYDQQAQMPVRNLFDSQMMAMAISVAKDMYDKQEQKIEKFRDKYGSFYSPTQSHMDFYNENFNTGKFLDDLYSRGIDPLRSAEGRAAVQQWINSRPIGELEQYKKSAETYQKFQDSIAELQSKGLYNPEFQDFVLHGKNINNLKRGEVWDVTAATPYQNLTQYADPLFNGMDPSYINTEDGYDIYGITPERRQQVLTATMGDILSTPLGRFHYEKARQNAAILLNRTPTEEEVQRQFADDVITATKKYDSIKKVENPDAKREKDFKYSKALHAANAATDHYYKMKERANTPGFDSNGNPIPRQTQDTKNPETLGIKASVQNTGISLLSGTEDPNRQALYMKANLRNIYNRAFHLAGGNRLKTIGKDSLPLYDIRNINKNDWQTFKNSIKDNLQFNIARQDFPQLINKAAVNDVKAKAGIVQIDKFDIDDIMSEDQVITNNYGYYAKKAPVYNGHSVRDNVREWLNEGLKVEAPPTGKAMPMLDKNTGEMYIAYEVEYIPIDPSTGERTQSRESIIGYIKDPQRSAYNDVNVNAIPVQNLDVSQKTINPTRSSEINSDRQYNASTKYQTEYSIPGSWIGYESPLYPLPTNP